MILNKEVKVGLIKQISSEQRLVGIGGVGHADKQQRAFQAMGIASGKVL